MDIKLLTYNIQAAIGTQRFSQYLTRAHHQVLNSKRKASTLDMIAKTISDYDVVCLQEVDLGGRRSGFTCQVDYLRYQSDLSHANLQENRVIRQISRHGNAILSRAEQDIVRDLKLPGRHKGRGAIITKLAGRHPVYVVNVHLSLGESDQMTQINHIVESIPTDHPVIFCGDFNCGAASLPVQYLSEALDLNLVTHPSDKTYPSWAPRHDFDHILVSKQFKISDKSVLEVTHSDHRPVSVTLSLQRRI